MVIQSSLPASLLPAPCPNVPACVAFQALFSPSILESLGPGLSASGSMQQAAAVALGLGQREKERRSSRTNGGARGLDGGVAPLPELVDLAIQSAPIDTRRALYKVSLSTPARIPAG